MIKTFKQFINEAQKYKLNTGDLDVKFGKFKNLQPYISNGKGLLGVTTYSVYSGAGLIPQIKELKSSDSTSPEYNKFIKNTALYISSKIITPNKIDVIVTPKSSSNILNDLNKEIAKRNPHIQFYAESMIKVVDPSDIVIDVTAPGINDTIIKSLQASIDQAKKDGYFQIKKVKKQFAKFISGFYTFGGKFGRYVKPESNILVIDDVLSTGTTLSEIYKILKKLGYSNIYGATMFKFQ